MAANGPIEVRLTQVNLSVECEVVYEDESTEPKDVYSLSMRGAQREMTGWFIKNGYVPVGRWQAEATEAGARGERDVETFRRFRPARKTHVDDELGQRETSSRLNASGLRMLDDAIRAALVELGIGSSESERNNIVNGVVARFYELARFSAPNQFHGESGKGEEGLPEE